MRHISLSCHRHWYTHLEYPPAVPLGVTQHLLLCSMKMFYSLWIVSLLIAILTVVPTSVIHLDN